MMTRTTTITAAATQFLFLPLASVSRAGLSQHVRVLLQQEALEAAGAPRDAARYGAADGAAADHDGVVHDVNGGSV